MFIWCTRCSKIKCIFFIHLCDSLRLPTILNGSDSIRYCCLCGGSGSELLGLLLSGKEFNIHHYDIYILDKEKSWRETYETWCSIEYSRIDTLVETIKKTYKSEMDIRCTFIEVDLLYIKKIRTLFIREKEQLIDVFHRYSLHHMNLYTIGIILYEWYNVLVYGISEMMDYNMEKTRDFLTCLSDMIIESSECSTPSHFYIIDPGIDDDYSSYSLVSHEFYNEKEVYIQQLYENKCCKLESQGRFKVCSSSVYWI